MSWHLKSFSLISFLLVSTMSFGQNKFSISLENEKITDFEKRQFFIKNVIDKNSNKVFTYSKISNSEQIDIIEYDTDLKREVNFLFLNSLPQKKNQIGLILIIDVLSSTENYGGKSEDLKITFQAKLVLEDEILYTNRIEKVFSNAKSYEEYPVFIVQTIQAFIYDFAMIDEPITSTKINESPKEENTISENMRVNLLQEDESRDVVAVGYQIGGFTLIGINYEFRASDNIGIHAGVGYRGFTAGIKIHWRPTKDGGFINISYKDGGFGEIVGWAVEYGSRKAFKKSKGSFGFHYQVGLVLITELSPEFRRAFGGVEPPFPSISLGLGFSW